jgi:YidC/Oxa1 family membrane protein insertase
MNDLNNKNFILAIVLSMAIIFGWQYFYAVPDAERAKQEAATSQTTTTTTTTAQVPGAAQPAAAITRDQALANSPRLKIETPELQGSINLAGAQLDDLHLTQYRKPLIPRARPLYCSRQPDHPMHFLPNRALLVPPEQQPSCLIPKLYGRHPPIWFWA